MIFFLLHISTKIAFLPQSCIQQPRKLRKKDTLRDHNTAIHCLNRYLLDHFWTVSSHPYRFFLFFVPLHYFSVLLLVQRGKLSWLTAAFGIVSYTQYFILWPPFGGKNGGVLAEKF